jgi:RNA recognition motif-containing protein
MRDKITSKTRGFGFVSLMRLEDYIKAMKEMEGIYVGNRPLKISRSKWKDRSADSNKDKLKDAVFIKHKKHVPVEK